MVTVCPGCRQHINETSAVMLQGGLVYHQRCAPAGRIDAPLAASVALFGVGLAMRWVARFYVWVILIAVACAFPPVGVVMLIGYGLVKWIASEFGKAVRRG